MKLNTFNPSFDDFMNCNGRILWRGGDVWKTDNEGIPHRHISKFGELLTVKIPDCFPMKYKNRKATRAVIYCNSCETVTSIEIHYSDPSVSGYAVVFDSNMNLQDVTNFYRKGSKK